MSDTASNFWDWFSRVSYRMALLPENHWAYIRIPKTGQTTVYRELVEKDAGTVPLGPRTNSKLFWDYVVGSGFSELQWNATKSYAMVRNPWDRAVSWWAYMQSDPVISGRSFRDFIEFELWNGHGMESWEHGLQCSYYTHYNGKQMVQRILRFEDFENSAKQILLGLGHSVGAVPHTNKSEHDHYTKYYDSDLVEMVAEMYKDDIALFGYEFGKD